MKYSITVLLSLLSIFSRLLAQDQSDRNSVVKFTPTKMMRGEILFGYERQMTEQSSFEVSLGPSISNVSPINVGHLIGFGTNATSKSLLGFTTSIAARYYPMEKKDALEGFYISPILGFTRLNYNFSDYGSGFNLEDRRGNSKQASFAFVFGTQRWLSNSFSLDMYVGSGLRQINEQNFYVDGGTWNGTNLAAPNWVEQVYYDIRWFITAGIKVGIGFSPR